MTKQEAIEILHKNKPISDPRICGKELCEAVDIAIKALESKKYESRALKLCTCGNKQKPQIWFDSQGGKFVKCSSCGKRSASATTELQARRNWNNSIKGEN